MRSGQVQRTGYGVVYYSRIAFVEDSGTNPSSVAEKQDLGTAAQAEPRALRKQRNYLPIGWEHNAPRVENNFQPLNVKAHHE